MEVKINKEIRNYTKSMFFGLPLRQFIFSVLACGVAVGLYFLLRPRFGTETLSWVCILGAFPFAAMGFIKYNGKIMNKFCEQFGLTPSARSRIVADTAEDKENDEAELLSWQDEIICTLFGTVTILSSLAQDES